MKQFNLYKPICRLAVATILATAFPACFTGIESTPKITANDVKRENIPDRPEDSYLSDVVPEPFSMWTSGKEFYISDSKFSLLLQPSDRPVDLNTGDRVIYRSASEVTDIKGDRLLELTFTSPDGSPVLYRLPLSESNDARAGKAVSIPFLIEMSVVNNVKERLKGNRYYIITSTWYDTDLKARTGRKFVPVTITDVKPGNSFYSTILELNDEKGQPFKLYLSAGSDLKALRHFGALFSLTDPHLSYPAISDANWENIINGRVAEEMTRDECRLALGSPAEVDRRAGYSSLREVWSYENGIYLIFEDGLLKYFRQ